MWYELGMTIEKTNAPWRRMLERHPRWMIVFSVMLGSLTATLWMTRTVVRGKFRGLDDSVLQWFKAQRTLELDRNILELTALGSETVLTIFTVVFISLMLFRGEPRRAFFVFLCIAGATVLTFTTKELIDRPRPDIVKALMIKPVSDSFPSGHAFVSMTFYLTIAWFVGPTVPTRAGRIYFMMFALLLSIAIGISRLYLGVHYLTDVVAGWCAGLAWVTACWLWLVLIEDRSGETEEIQQKV